MHYYCMPYGHMEIDIHTEDIPNLVLSRSVTYSVCHWLAVLCRLFNQVLLLVMLSYLWVSNFVIPLNSKICCHVHRKPLPDLLETAEFVLYSHNFLCKNNFNIIIQFTRRTTKLLISLKFSNQ